MTIFYKNFSQKRPLAGQSTIEYMILLAAVAGFLVSFMSANGTFRSQYHRTLTDGSKGMEDMAERMDESRYDSGTGGGTGGGSTGGGGTGGGGTGSGGGTGGGGTGGGGTGGSGGTGGGGGGTGGGEDDGGRQITAEAECGNGVLEQGEACDMNPTGVQDFIADTTDSCAKRDKDGGGYLSCKNDNGVCVVDDTTCYPFEPPPPEPECGDGDLEDGELCDVPDQFSDEVQNPSCELRGFSGGALICKEDNEQCVVSEENCYTCQGSLPPNTTQCPLPDTGSDGPWTVVQSCGNQSCTAACNAGYTLVNDPAGCQGPMDPMPCSIFVSEFQCTHITGCHWNGSNCTGSFRCADRSTSECETVTISDYGRESTYYSGCYYSDGQLEGCNQIADLQSMDTDDITDQAGCVYYRPDWNDPWPQPPLYHWRDVLAVDMNSKVVWDDSTVRNGRIPGQSFESGGYIYYRGGFRERQGPPQYLWNYLYYEICRIPIPEH